MLEQDREARKRALRASIRDKRNQRVGGGGGATVSAAASLLKDPTTALLSLGVDVDAAALAAAPQIVAAAKSMAHGTPRKALAPPASPLPSLGAPPPEPEEGGGDSSDDEAPPPPPS